MHYNEEHHRNSASQSHLQYSGQSRRHRSGRGDSASKMGYTEIK
jgi:hypothetical protein